MRRNNEHGDRLSKVLNLIGIITLMDSIITYRITFNESSKCRNHL